MITLLPLWNPAKIIIIIVFDFIAIFSKHYYAIIIQTNDEYKMP